MSTRRLSISIICVITIASAAAKNTLSDNPIPGLRKIIGNTDLMQVLPVFGG